MVWVCHQDLILKGIVREGPTLTGQYRVCLVDVPKADFLGFYKTGLQLLPREPEEIPEELSEVSDLQDLLGPVQKTPEKVAQSWGWSFPW
jgi:hypothetical protein